MYIKAFPVHYPQSSRFLPSKSVLWTVTSGSPLKGSSGVPVQVVRLIVSFPLEAHSVRQTVPGLQRRRETFLPSHVAPKVQIFSPTAVENFVRRSGHSGPNRSFWSVRGLRHKLYHPDFMVWDCSLFQVGFNFSLLFRKPYGYNFPLPLVSSFFLQPPLKTLLKLLKIHERPK